MYYSIYVCIKVKLFITYIVIYSIFYEHKYTKTHIYNKYTVFFF